MKNKQFKIEDNFRDLSDKKRISPERKKSTQYLFNQIQVNFRSECKHELFSNYTEKKHKDSEPRPPLQYSIFSN